jgi:hypothetical protein
MTLYTQVAGRASTTAPTTGASGKDSNGQPHISVKELAVPHWHDTRLWQQPLNPILHLYYDGQMSPPPLSVGITGERASVQPVPEECSPFPVAKSISTGEPKTAAKTPPAFYLGLGSKTWSHRRSQKAVGVTLLPKKHWQSRATP